MKNKYHRRTDANHRLVVENLRAVPGVTVLDLSAVGRGCPDILVGYAGRNILMEIKDGGKVPSAQKLTSPQVVFHGSWTGQATVVRSTGEALALLNDPSVP